MLLGCLDAFAPAGAMPFTPHAVYRVWWTEIERCAGPVNGARALFPVQIVARPLPARNGDLQPFMVVHATAMPAVFHGAAPTRAAPEAERCLATAVVGHALFIPRAATAAAEFQHVLTLQLPRARTLTPELP